MFEWSVQTMLFPPHFANPLVAESGTPQQSADGGAILLKGIDDQHGLTPQPTVCLPPEWWQAEKFELNLVTLVRQRCFSLVMPNPRSTKSSGLIISPSTSFSPSIPSCIG